MLKRWVHRKLSQMEAHYNYNVDYMRHVLDTDGNAFFKFGMFQTMSNHRVHVPAEVYSAATIRAALKEDCGPCVQLVTDMAIEAGVPANVVADIVAGRFEDMPEQVLLTVRFTDLVLDHNPEADDLREQLREQFGDKGLITISYAIATARVYPTLKYALGYGKSCQKVQVGDEFLVPELLGQSL